LEAAPPIREGQAAPLEVGSNQFEAVTCSL